MENYSKIFVIVVTYKGHLWYERCFTSLRNSEYPLQIIVIDNASNDGTIEYIRKHFPEIHLIESKENLGFGRANNLGLRYALDHDCDYVFLLNQDAWIEPNTLSELVYTHKKYPKYGLLSPMHINVENNQINMLLDDGNNNFELLNDLYFSKLNEIYLISYANAAAWLLPYKTLKIIGGFCPMFFYCGEDDDYMNRLRFHNIPMGLCPQIRITHDSKNRLKGSRELAKKAVAEDLHNILDINSPSGPIVLYLYHVRKLLLSYLNGNKFLIDFHKRKLKYLFVKLRKLRKIRKKHKTIGFHWL